MDATNKRRENLTWPDEDKTRKQLEVICELAKELRTDYPTDTPQIWDCIRNQRLNRRNTLIRAQFSTDEPAWHLINGTEWLELFDLLGFSVAKETRKRFASHLNWYSFWYANFKPRLSSKYAQRIHWYVHNFLFCLRNKLQTEKDYREGKYGSKGKAYFMEIEEQPATPPETPQISTENPQTAECIGESGYRVCSHCGKRFHEGYFLGDEYACSHECAVALYGGDEDQLDADLEEEEREPGTTECYWSIW